MSSKAFSSTSVSQMCGRLLLAALRQSYKSGGPDSSLGVMLGGKKCAIKFLGVGFPISVK